MPPAALQRGRGMPPPAAIGKNNTGTTNLNNPKANPNIKGNNPAGAPAQLPAAGATIGNLNRDGERSMGFQRPGMAQPPAQNAAAGYTPPSDIRKPGAPLNAGPNGQNMQRKQTGLIEPTPPVPGQPPPQNRNGQPLRPGEQAMITRDEPSIKTRGGLFSNMNPLKPKLDKKGNEILLETSTQNLPNKQEEGRGPLMPDFKTPAKPALVKNAAAQQNLAPLSNPSQQDESRGFHLPGGGKKGAAPPPKGAQPKANRNLSDAEASYLNTPLSKAAEEATGRGKTRAEKKGEMETKPKAGELPVKQPHRLHPQRNSFESDRSADPNNFWPYAMHKPACLLTPHFNQSATREGVWSQRHNVALGHLVPRQSRTHLTKSCPEFYPQATPGRAKARLHRPAMVKIRGVLLLLGSRPRDLLLGSVHEEHHLIPSDPVSPRSRGFWPQVPGTHAILPPCKMSPSNQ
ncbi:hypothetical protein UCDDA912_g08697 [Diaporthe ampelina]|uniref:Uncharacterized protein n=1 Tax=Diaporthe ampelina TaxID=1214573 RepID=A0A0G2H813_9PEZI|nr:hypothetical protein UCDDA912_g08697 [Diaporthe ampelina]